MSPGGSLDGKRILLVIGGGIAAYKSLDLVRRLRERGASVRCIMTQGAQQFVTPVAVSAVSGQRTHTDLFDREDEADIGHIKLARDADAVVVAPATANLMAKMAGGHADDLASTVMLATTLPILVAPAMNVRMWLHPTTQRNLATLRADGVRVVGPNEGAMAEAEFGPGRMA
ncbi:MAG: bifunctional phosphopantothenoylcysteine decarboxylase/phosphopantothenate synthase, partial [Pseudomonadota bacterium]|nr:bifunctional phosphopantothenoylcysteine decarboxylase/phosphopantothenate synthase [Pseudomonadota bacterium]